MRNSVKPARIRRATTGTLWFVRRITPSSRAKSRLDALRTEAKGDDVLAPFAGVLVETSVATGDLVAPQMPICKLVDDETLRARIPFREAEGSRIRPGMPATLGMVGHPDALTGEVEAIAPVVNSGPSGGTLVVEFSLRGARVRVGATANAEVRLQTKPQALVVDSRAIGKDGNRAFVYVVAPNGRVETRDVTVGLVNEGRSEILTGVSEGTGVVVDWAVTKLSLGARVRVAP